MTDPRDDLVFDIFAPGTGRHYDDIVEVTTAGRDREWKEELLGHLDRPRRVLDLACGTGILTFAIRDRFPEAEVVGVEINDEYLEVARRRQKERADDKVHFVLGPAEEAPLSGTFDTVLSCYLPKYADLPRLVPRLVERLDEGGLFIMHDFVYPSDPVVRRAWRWGFQQCLDWAARERPEAVAMFEMLPDVIRDSDWLEQLKLLLRENGMRNVSDHLMSHGQVALVWGTKPISAVPG